MCPHVDAHREPEMQQAVLLLQKRPLHLSQATARDLCVSGTGAAGLPVTLVALHGVEWKGRSQELAKGAR